MVFVHKESIYVYFIYSYYTFIGQRVEASWWCLYIKKFREFIFYLFFLSVFLFLFKYLQDGETREGASLSMVFVHKESSVTEGDAVGLDRDARSKIAFPISW